MPLLSDLKIDRHCGRTVSEQIAGHIEALVREGRLLGGTRLPSIRELAERAGVSCNAAVHAYELLTDRGLAAPRPCSGYYVSPQPVLGLLSSGPQSTKPLRLVQPISDGDGPVWRPAYDGPGDDLAALDGLRAGVHHLVHHFDAFAAASSTRVPSPLAQSSEPIPAPGRIAVVEDLTQDLLLQGVSGLGSAGMELATSLPQALLISLLALGLRRGDSILLEAPCDPHILGVVQALGLQPSFVRRSAQGLEFACGPAQSKGTPSGRAGQPVMVVMPSFHNPTGAVLSLDQRVRLLDAAAQMGLVVIELDLFPGLSFGEVCQVPLAALAGLERVVHIRPCGTVFSARLASHAVCGSSDFVRAARAWRERLADPRENDLELALLAQLLIRNGRRRQSDRLRRLLVARLRKIDGMLREFGTQAMRWEPPLGGVYVWLEGYAGAGEDARGDPWDRAPETIVVDQPDGFLVPGMAFGSDRALRLCCRLNLAQFDAHRSPLLLKSWAQRMLHACQH